MADVFVVGAANWDYLVKGRALPSAGETLIGETLHEGPGGKGMNQAVGCARLGARAAFMGCVGADERGRRLREVLAGEGVDASAVVETSAEPTGVALIMVDAHGEKLIATAPGANQRLLPSDVERATDQFANAKVVLLQLETGVATAVAIARCGREAGARVVLDAGPAAPVPDELFPLDVVRCNAGEARALTGIEVTDLDSAREAAVALRRRGAGAACIGARGGDLLVLPTDEVWLPYQHVDVVDATGAGDAFAAGLAVGLAENRSLTDAAWLACVTAALKTTRIGAQSLPTRAEVDRMLATIRRD